jgi:hypothetical protein
LDRSEAKTKHLHSPRARNPPPSGFCARTSR